MTSSNGNIFCVTAPLCREFTGHRWIPSTKASDAELWCHLWSALWMNGWVNNREAGDLRRQRTHYDVIVMTIYGMQITFFKQHNIQYNCKVCQKLYLVNEYFCHLLSSRKTVFVSCRNSATYCRFDLQFTVTGKFPAQRASNAENVPIWWRHHWWA